MTHDDASDLGLAVPTVLFVCVSNAGKSQMAAALLRHLAREGQVDVEVHSAGTRPGPALNAGSAAAVAEVGADMSGGHPKAVDPGLLARADRVVVLGTSARLDPVPGMRAPGIEVWATDEPSTRGIDGPDRMRLIRDDIAARCRRLLDELARG
ncbi:arsenate-mycothiol transferase ArsC [Terracoccus luteus]|uniref:Arsenate-mycothiol transferase n=1 Tax=Terracoccus luteus TaxID=53356 RepID=A0A839PSQ8_9MICO|nr:low molecular weight phosphatase family protein [Terracoccus luteus]MBB2987220.1 arsenate-mycothiol transferase [Terracoccus luteus]MCP2172871.1 arsenate-mycothiol transferase [Terracoccus luteus]